MNSKSFIAIMVGFLSAPPIIAQEMNAAMKGLFPDSKGGPLQKRSIKDLTPASQAELMRGTTRYSDHIEVEVSADYVDQISNLNLPSLQLRSLRRVSNEKIMGFSFLGVKEESQNRRAYFFGKDSKAFAMITLWYFAADGASTVNYKELINQKIEGMEATLSLTYNPSVKNCLWKLAANDDTRYYEISIPDQFLNKRAQMPVHQVLNEMQKMIDFVKRAE